MTKREGRRQRPRGSQTELRTLRRKTDLISRRSSPVKSLWSNVRHVPRSRLSYSIGIPVEAARAAFRPGMSERGVASVFWMASSITWSIVFAGPIFEVLAATAATTEAVIETGPAGLIAADGFGGAGAKTFRNLDTSA